MKRVFYLIFLLCICFLSSFQAEIKVSAFSSNATENYALFFAVNDYNSMRPLSNPIADAKAIAQELEKTYNFTTEVVENPTIEEIEAKLKWYANRFANKELDQNGQLFIYFSGHGVVDNQNGFFLAKDSDPDKLIRTAFAYEYWRPFINNVACKHILVAIDACFSGTFDPNWWSRSGGLKGRPGELSDSEKLIANHAQYTTRLFFTSATETESPDQSNFARKLLEGLRSGGGTDNILTSTELFAYVELANPKPHRGEFGKNEAGSSFLFIPSNPVEYVVDPDGNRYKTVKINGKIWLAENLNYDLGKDCWCYNDSMENCEKYGKLYTWEAAELSCRILGKDWRLPTDQEWRDLINFYGGYADGINITINGNTINKFPSTSKDHLMAYAQLIDNRDGYFGATLSGFYEKGWELFPQYRYQQIGKEGYYWSLSAYDGTRFNLKNSKSYKDYDELFTILGSMTFKTEEQIKTKSENYDISAYHNHYLGYGAIVIALFQDSTRIYRGLGKPNLGLSCRCIKE